MIDVTRDAVGDDTIMKVLDQLPDEFRMLFESGSEGQLQDRNRPMGTVRRDDWGGTPGQAPEGDGDAGAS